MDQSNKAPGNYPGALLRPLSLFMKVCLQTDLLAQVDDRVPQGGHEAATVLLALVKGQLMGQPYRRCRVTAHLLALIYEHS